jgi:phosphate transport system permease protein
MGGTNMNTPSIQEQKLPPRLIQNKKAFSFNRTFRVRMKNQLFKYFFLFSIAMLCFVLGLVIYLVAQTGLLTFNDISPSDFFLSLNWSPNDQQYGAGALIIGTLLLTGLTLIFAVPLSIGIALFTAEIAPTWFKRILRPILDLLVGIPSVIYGYIGLTVLIPLIRENSGEGLGDGLLAAALVLTIMILPTISRISDDAITSVPDSYRNAAYALGSTRLQTILFVVIPSARRGIMSAIILGMARAIGETMAVVMVIGNTPQLAKQLIMPTAVLTSNIVMQVSNVEFDSTWNHALYLMAFILLIISLILIIGIRLLKPKEESAA